jgi:hypothetical protein
MAFRNGADMRRLAEKLRRFFFDFAVVADIFTIHIG